MRETSSGWLVLWTKWARRRFSASGIWRARMRSSAPSLIPGRDRTRSRCTDAGALTVLLQDGVGGLQVYNDGLWYDVPPVEGALVINTGDMMQVWSNDRYRAAMHRVLASNEIERYSIPFFYNPMAGTVVEPLPSVVTAGQPANYRPIDWSDFRSKRTDGDYADYGPEVQIAQYRIAS